MYSVLFDPHLSEANPDEIVFPIRCKLRRTTWIPMISPVYPENYT